MVSSTFMFQSLSGFQVRCNSILSRRSDNSPSLFQSLSGFQVRCNSGARHGGDHGSRSFNPYRVFKFVATRLRLRNQRAGPGVSIPIGFSSSLQPKEHCLWAVRIETFQSLSGFQVRCNIFGHRERFDRRVVSIPIGFSSSLQRRVRSSIRANIDSFQSLSGFQVRCNHKPGPSGRRC